MAKQYVVIERSTLEALSPSEAVQQVVGPFASYPEASAYALRLDRKNERDDDPHESEVIELSAPEQDEKAL